MRQTEVGRVEELLEPLRVMVADRSLLLRAGCRFALTTTELEIIVGMIASGCELSEIATGLSLAAQTVSPYRTRALEKLSLTNSAQLVRDWIPVVEDVREAPVSYA